MSKKVIVIGAGPAGLTATLELARKGGYDITILESSDEIGGISRTVQHNGNRMDIGGHRFFSKDDRVNAWWNEILPLQGELSKDDIMLGRTINLNEGGPNPEKDDSVMLVRNRVSRIYYLRKFFDYPIKIKPRTFINMGLYRTIKAGTSYLYSAAIKREEKSLEDFYINRFGTALYSMFFENYTEKLWGVHPSGISPSWGAQRVKGLSLTKAVTSAIKSLFKSNKKEVETSLIEQFIYPKFGPGQFWEKVADIAVLAGAKLLKKHNVSKIVVSDGKIKSVECDNGEKFEADYFISTMPVKDLIIAMNSDVVPSNVYDIATSLPYRDFITVGLLVDKLKITNQTKMKTVGNIVPDCWIYIQEPDVKMGRLQIFNNWSPYMVKDFESKVWVGLEYFCTEGDVMWTMDDSTFIDMAISELEGMDIIEKGAVVDSTIVHVKKAYPAYFGSYDKFDVVREYLDSYDNLYCIGRNGQHRYNNMDHSMLTAFECVDNIVSCKTDKSNIWNVNVEGEYHEEKSKS